MKIEELKAVFARTTPGPWQPMGFVVYADRLVRDLAELRQPIRQETVCRVTAKPNENEDRANRDFIAQIHIAFPAIVMAAEAWTEAEFCSDEEREAMRALLVAVAAFRELEAIAPPETAETSHPYTEATRPPPE